MWKIMDQSSRPRDDLVAMKQEQGKGNWQHESSPSRSNYNTAMIGSEDLMLIIGGSVKMWVAISDDGVWFREKLLSDEAISGKLTANPPSDISRPKLPVWIPATGLISWNFFNMPFLLSLYWSVLMLGNAKGIS